MTRNVAVTVHPEAASSRRNQWPVNELPPVKRIFISGAEVPLGIEVARVAVLV